MSDSVSGWCVGSVRATKTEEPRFVVHPRSAFIRRGATADLRCTAAAGFTVTGWLHDGRPVTARRRDHLVVAGGLLTIKRFAHHGSAVETEGSDEGTYQCVATGPQGAVVSRPARLLTAGISFNTKAQFPLPELTARVDGWPVSITRQHGGPSTRRAVNSGR